MKMMNDKNHESVQSVSMYLTAREAEEMRDGLTVLLQDPEALEHFHVYSDDHRREISCSVITDRKLKELNNFNRQEKKILLED